MTINSVKKEDRGTYYCVADNNIGKPAQRAVSVEIEFAPTVTQTPSPGKYSLKMYSEETIPSFHECSPLLGFIVSKNLRGL